jgi:hypothetical protein
MSWRKRELPTFVIRRLNPAQVCFKCRKCGRLNIYGWPEGKDDYDIKLLTRGMASEIIAHRLGRPR